MNNIRKISHVLKHSRGSCVVGAFDKMLHKGSIWTGHRAGISFILHKSILLHFFYHDTRFYDKYIRSYDRKKYMDDDGSSVLPKQTDRKFYNARYQKTYLNR